MALVAFRSYIEPSHQTSCDYEVSFRQVSLACHQHLVACSLSFWACLLPFCYELNTEGADKAPQLHDEAVVDGLYGIHARLMPHFGRDCTT